MFAGSENIASHCTRRSRFRPMLRLAIAWIKVLPIQERTAYRIVQ